VNPGDVCVAIEWISAWDAQNEVKCLIDANHMFLVLGQTADDELISVWDLSRGERLKIHFDDLWHRAIVL
jgi:hypothetical protein